MQLVDEGLIDLDDPIERHVPAFASRFFDQFTVRHLLSHTSGLDGDYFASFGFGDDAIQRYAETSSASPVRSAPVTTRIAMPGSWCSAPSSNACDTRCSTRCCARVSSNPLGSPA